MTMPWRSAVDSETQAGRMYGTLRCVIAACDATWYESLPTVSKTAYSITIKYVDFCTYYGFVLVGLSDYLLYIVLAVTCNFALIFYESYACPYGPFSRLVVKS